MSTLYIIGNGLDLHLGLHTGTSDFIKYLKCERVYNEVMNAFDVFSCYGVDWNEYEEGLSNMDLEEVEAQKFEIPDYSSEHEYDRDSGIYNMQIYCDALTSAVRTALVNMVEAAEKEIEDNYRLNKCCCFGEKDAILSFNYTSTLDRICQNLSVPICHIHGSFVNGEELIFGYSISNVAYSNIMDREDEDYYINEQRRILEKFYKKWKKDLKVKELKNFLNQLGDIDTVKVYGHSMAKVDAEYMESVEETLNPKIWKISYHKSRSKIEDVIQHYSFAQKVELFEF